MFLILNNLFVLRFAPFLDHTEPTQSVTEQNPLFLTSTILPGPYPKVVHLLIIVPDTIWHRKSWTSHSGDEKWTSVRVLVPIHKLWVHENAHRSCTKSVLLVRIGRIFEHVALRHKFFSRIECASWESSSMQTLSLHPAFHNLGYLFSQELIAMYSIRQLTLLSQLLWSMTSWFEDSLSSHKLQSWNWLSSFQIPWSQGILQDAAPRLEISGTPSHHRENKFHQCDVKFHLHSGECFSNWISLDAQVSSSILLSSYVL